MFSRSELGSDGLSPCPSSLSSPGDSQYGSSLNFLNDDLISQPLIDFDEAECLAVIDDFDRKNPTLDSLHHHHHQHQHHDYEMTTLDGEYIETEEEASPSTKYYVLKGDNTLRPVGTSISFNHRTTLKMFSRSELGSDGLSPCPSSLSSPGDSQYGSSLNFLNDDLISQPLIDFDEAECLANPKGQGCVQLSAEEKRTLLQEGYRLPTKLPLSREEEEALKLVRRKIKNKLSAQESRRKRKEYMDMLEQKVHTYYTENATLRQRLKQAETANAELSRRIQELESSASL
uniref:BZIP domain-containing protein n=1 Tax=Panagrolaimus sp. ES5 TaxID=591445 RepID=A0AC34FDT7_9BILA